MDGFSSENAANLGAAGASRHPQRDCKPIGVTEKPPKTEKKPSRDNGDDGQRGREDGHSSSERIMLMQIQNPEFRIVTIS